MAEPEFVTLREFETRIKDRDIRVELALSAQEKAVVKAEAAINERLALLNEFRAQQSDEARKYALRELVEQIRKEMSERIGRQETITATLQGRALALAGFGALVGGLMVGLVMKLAG